MPACLVQVETFIQRETVLIEFTPQSPGQRTWLSARIRAMGSDAGVSETIEHHLIAFFVGNEES